MSQCVGFVSGAGIVPALSAVTRLLAKPTTSRVWLFYDRAGSADSSGDVPDALEQLLLLKDRNMARLSLGVVMDREPDEAALLSGQLDAGKVRLLAGRLFEPGAVDEYFICGPESFATEMRAALSDAGVPPARVHIERSDGEPSSPEAAKLDDRVSLPAGQARETQVSFVMDGRRRSFTMRTDEESILDAADRAGIELPFSCKAGVCATCRTKLVKGKVDLMENSALEDWELEQGFILACQARARTPEIELTYDEK
jgi:ring-1,2-phenylacetyl-CoA epoxidase subunit PaaE